MPVTVIVNEGLVAKTPQKFVAFQILVKSWTQLIGVKIKKRNRRNRTACLSSPGVVSDFDISESSFPLVLNLLLIPHCIWHMSRWLVNFKFVGLLELIQPQFADQCALRQMAGRLSHVKANAGGGKPAELGIPETNCLVLMCLQSDQMKENKSTD